VSELRVITRALVVAGGAMVLSAAGLMMGALTDDTHWIIPALVISGIGVVVTSLSARD